MTRRKSACLKWTLVLVLVIFCPYVCSRPQEQTVVSSSNLDIDKPTENPIRYRYRHYNVSSYSHRSPLDISFVDKTHTKSKNLTNSIIVQKIANLTDLILINDDNIKTNKSNLMSRRLSRVIRNRYKNRDQNDSKRKNSNRNKNATVRPLKNIKNSLDGVPNNKINSVLSEKESVSVIQAKTKPVIKKVVTKWTDNAKYEDLDFTFETTTSEESDAGVLKFTNSFSPSKYEAENNAAESEDPSDKRMPDKRYRPKPQYSEETQIYTSNVQIVDYPFASTRPPYIFNTPTPTPIITNVGYPQPWPDYQQRPIYQTVQHPPATQKPIKIAKPIKGPFDYHNTFHNNYPQQPNFEVTTFQPTTAYTDRIVIRPEEYSASPDECPTIFLTLNNTFQGQGKEVCPDLNIAVNTNVINKNVVIDSEEENDATLTEVFGIPISDDSESEEAPQDYFSDSLENQEEVESASVEATGLTNYNAANVAESSEPVAFGPPSAAISRPGRPNENDDDTFGLSSIISFFQPALNGFAWLATINPLSFGLLSLVLAPLVLLIAGTSGIAALFAPFAFSYGREAPKIVHIYRPQWQWDDEYQAWQLNSFPDRQWRPTSPRSNGNYTTTMRNSIRTTWFYKLKQLMKAATKVLNDAGKNASTQNNRKNKRKKRETWTIRVK